MTNRPPPILASPFVSTILSPLKEFVTTCASRTSPQKSATGSWKPVWKRHTSFRQYRTSIALPWKSGSPYGQTNRRGAQEWQDSSYDGGRDERQRKSEVATLSRSSGVPIACGQRQVGRGCGTMQQGLGDWSSRVS